MLSFGRAALPRRATLQTSDQIVIQITYMQVPSHPALHEIIDLNDLTWCMPVKIRSLLRRQLAMVSKPEKSILRRSKDRPHCTQAARLKGVKFQTAQPLPFKLA
jgi:hypothetical protein